MTLVVLVPVLDRPHNVAPLVESLRATAPDVDLLFVTSPGCDAEREAIRAAGADMLEAPWHGQVVGDYAKKINLGYRSTTADLILCGADDIRFRAGWLEAVLEQAADPRAGVIGTNDLANPRVIRGEHSTHPVVARWYADIGAVADRPASIYYEGYWHECVDDELVQVAQARGVWRFAERAHVEHLHPNWGTAPEDEVYSMQAARLRFGHRVLKRRRAMWT